MIETVSAIVVAIWILHRLRRGPEVPPLGSIGDGEQTLCLLPKGSIQRRRTSP